MIEVLIADDSTAFRRALTSLLAPVEDIRVVGEAKNGKQAINLTASLRPHVVVMDIGMPVLNGLRATRHIADYFTETKVLILSAHSEPEYFREAIRCGARGYLLKNSAGAILARAICDIKNGESYFDANVSTLLRSQCRDISAKSTALKRRTYRAVG